MRELRPPHGAAPDFSQSSRGTQNKIPSGDRHEYSTRVNRKVKHNFAICPGYASFRFRHAVANAKVFERQLVAPRYRMFSPRLQARVVSEISSDAIGVWLQIDYGNTDIVGGIVHEKMNHRSSFRRSNFA
jgi:hypothetical protein